MLYVTAPVLGNVNHGFWGRNGGVSTGHFGSMNLAVTKGDTTDNVRRNREIISQTINAQLLTVEQVHGNDVAIVDKPWEFLDPQTPKVDAIVSNTPGIAIGIITADCVPILIHDPINKTIAAIHAGWRGAHKGVIASTIKAMQSLGCQSENLICAIGPCIQQDNYEVSVHLYDDFTRINPTYALYFKPKGDRYNFDLMGTVKDQLLSSGIKQIENTGICTYDDELNYFSCRRATHKQEPTFGCQLSFIAL